jgi:hypothetical protein
VLKSGAEFPQSDKELFTEQHGAMNEKSNAAHMHVYYNVMRIVYVVRNISSSLADGGKVHIPGRY